MPDQTRQLVAAAHKRPTKIPQTQGLEGLARQDARKYGVPEQVFVNQIRQESGFNPNARSSAGAEGIAQFMPATAAGFHIDPRNPVQALDAAARYDSQLQSKYGSIARALSAYNSGRPDAYKDPNFAHGETFNYVNKILGGASSPVAAQPTNPSFGAPATGSNSGFASALIGGMNKKGLLDPSALVRALQMRGGGQPTVTPSAGPTVQQGGPLAFQGDTTGLDPAFLQREKAAASAVGASAIKSISGYRDPQHNAAVGGVQGSQHTRGNADDGYALINGQWVPLGVALKPVAGRFGLRSGAVPGFFNGRPDPNHVDGGLG